MLIYFFKFKIIIILFGLFNLLSKKYKFNANYLDFKFFKFDILNNIKTKEIYR